MVTEAPAKPASLTVIVGSFTSFGGKPALKVNRIDFP
jgi:hypothetical protein